MNELVNFLWWANVPMFVFLMLILIFHIWDRTTNPTAYEWGLKTTRPSFVWMLVISFGVFIGGFISG